MLSVVIPVYNSEATIGRLVDALAEAIRSEALEIVLVNDGSADNSYQICLDLTKKYPDTVRFLHLSRNFGEHNAVMAGLHHAKGDWVVIMDDDLQNAVSDVPALLEYAKTNTHDVVFTHSDTVEQTWFRRLGSRFNDWMATKLIRKPKNLYLSSFKIMNRFLVDEIIRYEGPFPYIDGLILRTTNNIGAMKVTHQKRAVGRSGYTLRKLIRLYMNMFLNFSITPLRVSSFLGFVLTILGFVYGLETFVEKFFNPEMPIGYPSAVILFILLTGMQLLMLGLVGEYLGSMFLGANRTPQFIVREKHGR